MAFRIAVGSDWAFMRLPSPGVCLYLVSTSELMEQADSWGLAQGIFLGGQARQLEFPVVVQRAEVRLRFSSMALEPTPTYTYVTHDFTNVSTPSNQKK